MIEPSFFAGVGPRWSIRTSAAAAGVTGTARTAGSALGPLVTGALFGASLFSAPFFLAGGLKLVYDLALYLCFRALKPPEEQTPR